MDEAKLREFAASTDMPDHCPFNMTVTVGNMKEFLAQAARIAELEHEAAVMRNAAHALIDTIANGTHWENNRPSLYNGSINDLYGDAIRLQEALGTDAGQRVAKLEHEAAAMREALLKAYSVLDMYLPDDPACDVARQALTADAGQRVADVVRAADLVDQIYAQEQWPTRDWNAALEKLHEAVCAYRAALDGKAER